MLRFSPIAITGIGFVTSLGDDSAGVVAALRSGISGVRRYDFGGGFELPVGRVNEDVFCQGQGDMAGPFALAATKGAWRESGLELGEFDSWRVGTFIGSSKGRLGNLIGEGGLALDPRNFPGDTLGLQVARAMGFAGPVLNYPAACATGTNCIVQAAHYLQDGSIDIAVAGSGEAGCLPLILAGFNNMGALSGEIARPFDVERAGFNPGEGAAAFVLEREGDARARGATILARIVGGDIRSDAFHITSAEDSGAVVSYAIERTLKLAGWDPADVDYVNAHGTGTRLNDVVEGRAIRRVFGGHQPFVSSLKPNIGHLLGASSAVELAVSMVCLKDGFLPPTLGLETPDPDIPLRFVTGKDSREGVDRYIKLSLGFGGHIGMLAIELT